MHDSVPVFVLCGGASSPPYWMVGGCERSHTSPFAPRRETSSLFFFPWSFRSLIYSVSQNGTRMSIRSRECPNHSGRVDLLTMRQHRCAPELVPPSAGLQCVPPTASGNRR